ncbi:hypothetical protein, partial [Mycobacterium kubicae]|uniref:hypothetical protein n=1 Tax=Mycobacterium kubicae TaxID=120959 RepID=UPI001A964EA7
GRHRGQGLAHAEALADLNPRADDRRARRVDVLGARIFTRGGGGRRGWGAYLFSADPAAALGRD